MYVSFICGFLPLQTFALDVKSNQTNEQDVKKKRHYQKSQFLEIIFFQFCV